MTLLLAAAFCSSTFLRRWSSTNGPFFRLRDMVAPSTGAAAACGDDGR